MKKTTETGISCWKNGEKSCTVITKREMGDNAKNRYPNVYKATFNGWNPFPCYSMNTTIDVLFDWLYANGWIMEVGGKRIVKVTEFDDDTKEIVSEKETITVWIPVHSYNS